MTSREARIDALKRATAERIVFFDGAMGTMIQHPAPPEDDFCGARFKGHHRDVKGDSDVLAMTRPDLIRQIHADYFEAGADIATTNTFNANAISQEDYDLQDYAREMNVAAAQVAREAANDWTARTPDRPRFVAGSMGPTNRTASISPDVNNPGHRNVTFDELVEAYADQARGLIEGSADILMIETVFDTLNAKAAGFAILKVYDEVGFSLPLMVSDTITDLSGRNLSGQTVEAFWYSMRHLKPFSIGLNCSFGADQLRPAVAELSSVADTLVSVHPNAGLPNEMGEYDESPAEMAGKLEEWAKAGFLNIVGGCCGTTPEHIRAIAEAVAPYPPREVPQAKPELRLSGLEPFTHA